ncbi:hypothetical protein BYT27DRAFT_7092250 [Phlegmacium glaucopus]|nr:hypothetical protein BYT27DRAFT_7092250 [Phlegmacium glaucopus]
MSIQLPLHPSLPSLGPSFHHPINNNLSLPPQSSAPVQYVYCLPPPSSSSSSASPSKPLPSVSHIPLLTNKFDFFTWDDAVTSLLRANGLIGHILDPS